jgi:hypothetical protein
MLSSWTLPETFPETFLVVQEDVPRKVPKESIVSAFGNVPKVVIPKERTCQSSRLFSLLLCARKPHTLPLLHAHFWCSSKTAKKSARARALVTHLVTGVCDSISRCCVFLQAIGRIALQNFKVLHACALKRKEEPFACDCCGDTCDSFSCCLVEGGGLIISKWVPDWVLCIRWMPELEGRKNQSGESIERQQRNHHLKT